MAFRTLEISKPADIHIRRGQLDVEAIIGDEITTKSTSKFRHFVQLLLCKCLK